MDILQEAIAQDKKINLFIVSGTSHLLSGPTGYIHSLQELFFTLNGTVLQPFKGVNSLRSINFPAPLMVRAEMTKGLSVNDMLIKLWLKAVHASRQLVVWNTNDITITNRSHTNNVAIETYVPGRNEQEFRESNFFEVLPTLYHNQNHLVALKLATKEGTRAAAYRSRNSINLSPMYEAEYIAAIWEDVLNHKLPVSSAEIKVSPLVML